MNHMPTLQLSQPLNDVDNLINQLNKEVLAEQRSGAGMLSLATELCQRLGAVQIISCDSGVHRYVRTYKKLCVRDIEVH